MDQQELMPRVRALRGQGRTPKAIARLLGVPLSTVTPLVRAVAAEDEASALARGSVEYLVSPGWSYGLGVQGHPEWPGAEAVESGTSGLVSVLAARAEGRGRVSVCGWLVDAWCLGVKDAAPPRVLRQSDAAVFTRRFFGAYDAALLPAPVDLVQHLVFGAVAYARGLGFEPNRDFKATLGHLGEWTGPSAITFGRDGKPFYVQGPHDDVAGVLRTLERTVGPGDHDFLIAPSPPNADAGSPW